MTNPIKKKILVISPGSSLTGAPILLVNLLELVKKYDLFHFEILLYRGGPLENEFKKLGKTDVLKEKEYSLDKKIFKRFKNYVRYRIKLKKWKSKIKNFDLVFSNTITNGRLLKSFAKRQLPVICYIHELESIIQEYRNNAFLTFQIANVLAVPSHHVKDNLRLKHSFPKQKIFRLDYFFPINPVEKPLSKQDAKKLFLEKYNLAEDKFYVVSMGTATLRKGIDFFMEVCEECKTNKEIFFVWIGDFVDNVTKEKTTKKIDDSSMNKNFLLTGYLPYSSFNLLPFDLFLLTSREDPYPLVVIEAAFQKIPTLCFNSGGAAEFVSDNCGWIIQDFSPKEMAKKILELEKNMPAIKTVGDKAYKKAIELHTDESKIISQLNQIISEAIS